MTSPRYARPAAALVLLGALALGAADLVAGGRIAAAAKWALGAPARLRRAALRSAAPPLAQLAASQVGYGPTMQKRFTSSRPFGAFTVVREPDRTVAFRGGAPARAIPTDLLGEATRTVWIGDFTALSRPGRYRIVTDDGRASAPFDVGAEVFDPAVRAVQRALFFQRAFTAIDPAHAEGPWTHPSDAHLAPPGEVKGWHDAGDLSLYVATTATTIFWLLQTWLDFAPAGDDTNIPESGNGVPDLLDEARWGLEWLLSVQEPSGGFRNTTCQQAYGPYGANPPEGARPYRAGEVGTIATARAVGTLAEAAIVFRPHDPSFAARCLEAARRGHDFLAARPDEQSDGPTCPAFRQDGDAQAGRDVRMFAAAGMLLATGEARYRDAFEASWSDLVNDPSYLRTNVYAALLYLRAPAGDPARKAVIRARLAERAAEARADGAAHPFEWATRYFWGSINAAFLRSGAFGARVCLDEPRSVECEQPLANVHYALGRNSLEQVYVSGLPGVTRGRTHAFHHWLATLRAEPFLFPGLVAGGPTAAPVATDVSYPHARPLPIWGYFGDPASPRDAATPIDGRYTDNDSWCTNELDVEWQAVALYNLHFARWAAMGRPPR